MDSKKVIKVSKKKKKSNTVDWKKNTWDVIDSYFKNSHNLVRHQLESYNYFMTTGIRNIIRESSPIIISIHFDPETKRITEEFHINFLNVYIGKPVINENTGKIKIMYPQDARLRDLTYNAAVSIDLTYKTVKYKQEDDGEIGVYEEGHNTLKKVFIGKIPIMLHSKFCSLNELSNKTNTELGEGKYDRGGYFIIKGSEKVLVSQEKKCENKIYVFPQNKQISKYSHVAEVRSVVEDNLSIQRDFRVKLTAKDNKFGKTIKIKFVRIKSGIDIPLFVLFRALGFISDKEIVEFIVSDISNPKNRMYIDMLKPSINEAKSIDSQVMALEYISKFINLKYYLSAEHTEEMKLKYVQDIIMEDVFPHLGGSKIKKAYYLGRMVLKLLNVSSGIIKNDDRDSFCNKRVETAGALLINLFRDQWIKVKSDLEKALIKDVKQGRLSELTNNLDKKIKASTIETALEYSLASGNWGVKNQAIERKGVAQTLKRLSSISALSHLRRLVNPIGKSSGKKVQTRGLHNTQFGYICAVESPEGANVGIHKNLALMTHVTVPISSEPIRIQLKELGTEFLENIKPMEVMYFTKVIINGDWIGIHRKPYELIAELRKLRREGVINIFTSISWDINLGEINVYTDGGRLCRPLYVVDNNEILLTNSIVEKLKNNDIGWHHLLSKTNKNPLSYWKTPDITGNKTIIEYIDVSEENTRMIAMTHDDLKKNKKHNKSFFNYTHCEIHPSMMFGVLASNIPFSDHNQAPRNVYQCAMGKQAMGVYATNFRKRFDTLGHVLYYPQKPLVTTRGNTYTGADELPSGINAIVAIQCYTGYNQEDSLILNEDSIKRGLFVSSYYHTSKDTVQKNQSTIDEEKFMKPTKYNEQGNILTTMMKAGNYDKLDENGFIKIGSKVGKNDVIIGKVIPLKQTSPDDPKYKDASTMIRTSEEGTVDWVYSNINHDGYRFAKVRIRSERVPIIGDKFSSRHGQKGTCGIMYKQFDMPFTKQGITPDIIVNPQALPSRMTIGHLIECLLGKVSTINGHQSDATPFTGMSVHEVSKVMMEKCGFECMGTQVLYNGKTGEQIKANIFIGPTYYQRLKHLVADKIHSRSSGPYVQLTRQPVDGRSRSGGLRCGEMERDALLAHGTSQFLKERLFDVSDKYFVYVCNKTGFIAVGNKEKNLFKSLYSDEETNFSKIQIPYAAKLFIQELMSLGIAPRIRTSKSNKYVLAYRTEDGEYKSKEIIGKKVNDIDVIQEVEEETDDEDQTEDELEEDIIESVSETDEQEILDTGGDEDEGDDDIEDDEQLQDDNVEEDLVAED